MRLFDKILERLRGKEKNAAPPDLPEFVPPATSAEQPEPLLPVTEETLEPKKLYAAIRGQAEARFDRQALEKLDRRSKTLLFTTVLATGASMIGVATSVAVSLTSQSPETDNSHVFAILGAIQGVFGVTSAKMGNRAKANASRLADKLDEPFYFDKEKVDQYLESDEGKDQDAEAFQENLSNFATSLNRGVYNTLKAADLELAYTSENTKIKLAAQRLILNIQQNNNYKPGSIPIPLEVSDKSNLGKEIISNFSREATIPVQDKIISLDVDEGVNLSKDLEDKIEKLEGKYQQAFSNYYNKQLNYNLEGHKGNKYPFKKFKSDLALLAQERNEINRELPDEASPLNITCNFYENAVHYSNHRNNKKLDKAYQLSEHQQLAAISALSKSCHPSIAVERDNHLLNDINEDFKHVDGRATLVSKNSPDVRNDLLKATEKELNRLLTKAQTGDEKSYFALKYLVEENKFIEESYTSECLSDLSETIERLKNNTRAFNNNTSASRYEQVKGFVNTLKDNDKTKGHLAFTEHGVSESVVNQVKLISKGCDTFIKPQDFREKTDKIVGKAVEKAVKKMHKGGWFGQAAFSAKAGLKESEKVEAPLEKAAQKIVNGFGGLGKGAEKMFALAYEISGNEASATSQILDVYAKKIEESLVGANLPDTQKNTLIAKVKEKLSERIKTKGQSLDHSIETPETSRTNRDPAIDNPEEITGSKPATLGELPSGKQSSAPKAEAAAEAAVQVNSDTTIVDSNSQNTQFITIESEPGKPKVNNGEIIYYHPEDMKIDEHGAGTLKVGAEDRAITYKIDMEAYREDPAKYIVTEVSYGNGVNAEIALQVSNTPEHVRDIVKGKITTNEKGVNAKFNGDGKEIVNNVCEDYMEAVGAAEIDGPTAEVSM